MSTEEPQQNRKQTPAFLLSGPIITAIFITFWHCHFKPDVDESCSSPFPTSALPDNDGSILFGYFTSFHYEVTTQWCPNDVTPPPLPTNSSSWQLRITVILLGRHLPTPSHEHPLLATLLRFQRSPHGKDNVGKMLYLSRTVNHNSRKFPLMSYPLWQVVARCTRKKPFPDSSRGLDKIFIGVVDVLIQKPSPPYPPKTILTGEVCGWASISLLL